MDRPAPIHPHSPRPLEIQVLLAEYEALHRLLLTRLQVMERRAPLLGGAFAAFLASASSLPHTSRLLLLLVAPLVLLWAVTSTFGHARSKEDLLVRIAQVERELNLRCGAPLLRFQSEHPSYGGPVGGRTGAAVIAATLVSSLLTLVACVVLVRASGVSPLLVRQYALYATAVALLVLRSLCRLARYPHRRH